MSNDFQCIFIVRIYIILSYPSLGFVIGINDNLPATKQTATIQKLAHQKDLSTIFEHSSSIKNASSPLIYVYAKHGKSARQQLWSLNDLSDSNSNLIEVSPNRDPSQYYIPAEGIAQTLCSKSVLLSPKCPSLAHTHQY